MNDVKFKFDEPSHGWMRITVSDEVKEVALQISDVPCNSIYKLSSILTSLLDTNAEEEVEFSLEPEYALWKFKVGGEELELEVYSNSGRHSPVVFTGKSIQIAHRLYKGLRDLEAMSCWKQADALESVWSWEFPSRELNDFKAIYKNA